jgi:hypothetical protein
MTTTVFSRILLGVAALTGLLAFSAMGLKPWRSSNYGRGHQAFPAIDART